MEMTIPIHPMYQQVMEKFKERNYLKSDIGMKKLLDSDMLYANTYDVDRVGNSSKFTEIDLSDIKGTITNINPDNMTIIVKNMKQPLADINITAIPRILATPDLETLRFITFDIRPIEVGIRRILYDNPN